MKIIIVYIALVTSVFSMSLKDEIERCSVLNENQDRLECYDRVAKKLKPSDEFISKGLLLVKECKNCHGKNWEISTNAKRLVKDMNENEIYNSLLAYKNKKKKFLAMNFQMNKYTKEEIKLMAEYINYEILTSK
ncbi:c-type cytochrome [Arcobacter sp. YIC-464]|uniref:c-type cytochrome n=1 Tax=Arcobacter sp. YIC-464 TaxID=3376631 RepID=UPI003C24B738